MRGFSPGAKPGTTTTPAGTAAADGESNATTMSRIGTRLFGFNGTTWDRIKAGITAATTTVTGWLNVIPGAIYSTSKPTLTNGQYSSLQLNVNGALDVDEVNMPGYENGTDGTAWTQKRALTTNTSGSPSNVGGVVALSKSTVVAAATTRFYGARVRLDATATAGTYYVQIHNATSLPADTAVPIRSFKVVMPTVQVDVYLDLHQLYKDFGLYCSTGCVVALSSTYGTLTLAGTSWMAVEDYVAG